MAQRTDIVVSPLISLMKDQVDSLRSCGYPATAMHSGMTRAQNRDAEIFFSSGKCRLLFVAPERLVSAGFLDLIARHNNSAFAIDEAHCISHWGHDFRPEYRHLSLLRKRFPEASIHAYTATASDGVRQDIIQQLALREPAVLVGTFDRPNLVYRILPRQELRRQVRDVLERHVNQAVIIYCISRAETERLAVYLKNSGLRAAHYHAGMTAEERRQTHDAFSQERLDVMVATVAFGMGIDRSNVRCVIHAAMPKSVEHYQQETGRAGRDGLEAECVLFYSAADALRWKSLHEKTADEGQSPAAVRQAAIGLLEGMRRFCSPGRCRHRSLSQYFGQAYSPENCQACDVCLEESGSLEDGTITAQMILSCVAKTGQRFGVGHTVDVLRGADTQQIRSLKHDRLSTFGLMRETPKKALINTVYQLVDQDILARDSGEFPVLRLNENSAQVLRNQRKVWLLPSPPRKAKKTTHETKSWHGVDRDLFDELRKLRTDLARDRGVPAYVIFSDASLRDMARRCPVSSETFLATHGVGEKKLADFGNLFMSRIQAYLARHETTQPRAQSPSHETESGEQEGGALAL